MSKIDNKIILISPDNIQPHPEGQAREEFPEERIAEMAETYKITGQINPTIIDRDNFIIAGEMRWRAAKLAGMKKMPVRIGHPDDSFDRMRMQIIENDQVTPLTAFERATHYNRMHIEFLKSYKKNKGGMDKGIRAMAEAIGIGKIMLSQSLQLVNDNRITPELRELGERVGLDSNIIMNIARLPNNIKKRIVQRCINTLNKGEKVVMTSRFLTDSLFSLLRRKPKLLEAALDIILTQNITMKDKIIRLDVLTKEKKTEAEQVQDGLNNVLRASNTLEKALNYWQDDVNNIPTSCRDIVLTKWGHLYKRLDAFFESTIELDMGGE